MNRTSHRTLAGALAVAVALLVSACGASGGSDADDDDKPTTTAATTEQTTTTPDETTTTADDDDDDGGDDAAEARAESIELTVSDFPDGWTANEPKDDDDEPSGIEECSGTSSDGDVLAEHATDDFVLGDLSADDGVQVSIETKVFTDEAAAEAALEPFTDEEVIACVSDLFKEQFGTGGTTIEGSIEIDEYGDTAADQAVAAAGEYTVTPANGEPVTVTVGVAVLRTGDLATQILVTGVGPTIQDVELGPVAARVEELQAEA